MFTAELQVPDYDIQTYLKKLEGLKQRFKDAFHPEDFKTIFSTKVEVLPDIKPVARRVRSFGADSQWKEICYGAKKNMFGVYQILYLFFP